MPCIENAPATPVSAQTACLIVEPMPLVAHDLATTLRDSLRCPTLVASSEAEAARLLATLSPDAPLHMAIIRMAPDLFANSPLRSLIEARSARVILMGTEPSTMENAQPWPWALLEWPFGTGQLLTLLDSLGLLPDTR